MRSNYNGTLLDEPKSRLEFLYQMCNHIQHLIYNTDKFAEFSDQEVFAIDVATSRYADELHRRLYGQG